MHRTPHRPTKENHQRTPLRENANRRDEGSSKKQRWEEVPSDDLPNEGKRENARSRRFDIRVSNISSIEDKIYGLLSLVKRDKLDEPLPKHSFEKGPLQGRLKPSKQDHSAKESEDALRFNAQSISNPRQPLGVYNFNREVKIDVGEHVLRKGYDYTPRNQSKTPSKYDVSAKVEKLASKRTYLPVQYDQKIALTPKSKQPKNLLLEEQAQERKYEIKVQRRNEEIVGNKPRSIKEEVELRLRERQRNQQIQRPQTAKSQAKSEALFQNITIHTQKKQQAPKKDFSLLHSSIPKPEASSFKPIAIAEESSRAQKLTTTTKLIDEQIRRIRGKIEQSKSHSQWMNSKMERQEERDCVSQTYIEQEFDPEV